jgi:CHAT domain-containing protein
LHGPNDNRALQARFQKGNTLINLAQYPEALTIHQAVLDQRVKRLGTDHPSAMNARNAIANVSKNLGRVKEATALELEAAQAKEKRRGKDEDELASLNKKTGGVMEGDTYIDDAFTLSRMKTTLSDQRPVLHIACHFKFTPGTEPDSYLLLGDGARLSLRQIRENDLQFDHVDHLTLSACETAVGDNAKGSELEGLAAIAQKQGAKAVRPLCGLSPIRARGFLCAKCMAFA